MITVTMKYDTKLLYEAENETLSANPSLITIFEKDVKYILQIGESISVLNS